MIRVFLIVTSLVFLSFGLWGLFDPVGLVAQFDISVRSGDGTAFIRTIYGGFLLGVAALLGWSSLAVDRLRYGLMALTLFLVPVMAARTFGIIVDNGGSMRHWSYLALEAVGLGLALFFLARERRI